MAVNFIRLQMIFVVMANAHRRKRGEGVSEIYTVLVAIFVLILSVNINRKKEWSVFVRGMLLMLSFLLLIVSIPLHIFL